MLPRHGSNTRGLRAEFLAAAGMHRSVHWSHMNRLWGE
jgi:hypothetical protein